MAVSACFLSIGREQEVHSNFVSTCQVGVLNFAVGNFECGAVLNIERELCLAEFALAPIPSAQCMLLVFEVHAIPDLECP